MSNKQLRTTIRWLHIIGGALISTFIYSSTLNALPLANVLIKAVVIPGLISSGLVLWQQPRIVKFFKQRKGQ